MMALSGVNRQKKANPRSSRAMILTCPECRTRYQVADQAVSQPSGRTVRCANCGQSWHYLPQPPPAPVSRVRDEPPPLPSAALAATARAAIIAPPPRHRHGGGLGTLVVVLLLGALAAGAYFGRDRIVALWPEAQRLYGMVGLGVDAPGEGLDIANVTSTRNVDGLIVEGDITDKVGVPRPVPKLRVVLRDGSQHDVAVKIIDPPKPRLLPGETAHFLVAFLPASDAAVGVVVTFVAG
jgi:predicted Zn finger-like uncharacterized protein